MNRGWAHRVPLLAEGLLAVDGFWRFSSGYNYWLVSYTSVNRSLLMFMQATLTKFSLKERHESAQEGACGERVSEGIE